MTQPSGRLRIVLTGATGLLGRNLLFEIIKQNFNNLENIEIIILGRDIENQRIFKRVEDILFQDGIQYLALNKNNLDRLSNFWKNHIKCFFMDLSQKDLSLNKEDVNYLSKNSIDFFFHIAALTDFRDSPLIRKNLEIVNVQGTRNILELISSLNVRELIYISSAYSCGKTEGNIKPDYINFNQGFRNPYELSKLKAEILVRNFEKEKKIKCRYFRPSTIIGRLIELPLGSTYKFDVFYSWIAFFLRYKSKSINKKEDLYKHSINLDIRICYNSNSGLNMVPVDFAAKTIYQVCLQNDSGSSYHLVNEEETPHDVYLISVLKEYNMSGIYWVDNIPVNMNKIEEFYYKTVGKIFTPYINSLPLLFNTDTIKPALKKINLSCPNLDKKNLQYLTNYAKEYNYGL